MPPLLAESAWVEGRNPFRLAKPSTWWLQLLVDYDADLVLMPSVKDYSYRLCRRVVHQRQDLIGPAAALHGHPDTVQMARFGLVPIATLTLWAIRSDKVIRDLMARDTFRAGAKKPHGTDRIVTELEYKEELVARKKDRDTQSSLDAINGEAFRSLQFRTGAAAGQVGGFASRPYKTVSSPASAVVTPPSLPGPTILLADA